jgi:tRNA-specific 2-thiouridylase
MGVPGRILVAMSGGVDSSVAAARLLASGFEVVGVTLHLWDYPDDGSAKGRCCAPGIPHYAFDRRELFGQRVVEPFVASYLAGETPSPCVWCNHQVKFGELFRLAERLGADGVATGHYARLGWDQEHIRLLRGADRSKDQAYFLYTLSASELSRLYLPLGDSTKAEVRAEAVRLALPGATKGESQELCFVPTGRYDTFVAERAPYPIPSGPIVDSHLRRVGTHLGIHGYTVGQRRNLGVALGERMYVVGIDAESATVKLGPHAMLLARGAELVDTSLAEGVELPLECEVAIRYRGETVAARVTPSEAGGHRVGFRQPVAAVVPGQFAVFYRSEQVLGGGRIRRALGEGLCL